MKHYLSLASLLIVALVGLNSCGIVKYVDAGQTLNPSPVKGEHIRYMGTFEGTSHPEVYVFGIGGAHNHESAIREMIEKADMVEGEELVNITCVSYTKFIPFTWLPIVTIRQYSATADKISRNIAAPVASDAAAVAEEAVAVAADAPAAAAQPAAANIIDEPSIQELADKNANKCYIAWLMKTNHIATAYTPEIRSYFDFAEIQEMVQSLSADQLRARSKSHDPYFEKYRK